MQKNMVVYYMTTFLPMLNRCLGLLIGLSYFSRIMPPTSTSIHKDISFSLSVPILPWPAQSPDLNIIENIWLFIKNKLNCDPRGPPTTKEELQTRVISEWDRIPQDFIGKLYESLPGRILAVKKRCYPTKY